MCLTLCPSFTLMVSDGSKVWGTQTPASLTGFFLSFSLSFCFQSVTRQLQDADGISAALKSESRHDSGSGSLLSYPFDGADAMFMASYKPQSTLRFLMFHLHLHSVLCTCRMSEVLPVWVFKLSFCQWVYWMCVLLQLFGRTNEYRVLITQCYNYVGDAGPACLKF